MKTIKGEGNGSMPEWVREAIENPEYQPKVEQLPMPLRDAIKELVAHMIAQAEANNDTV